MQSRGQGRDAARKRAGAEFPESRRFRAFSKGLCLGVRANLGLAFALRRDGTAGGVCARGRRQDQNSRHLDTNKDYDTGVRSRAFATTSSKHGAWGQGLAVLAILRNAGAGTRGRYAITATVASINVAKAVRGTNQPETHSRMNSSHSRSCASRFSGRRKKPRLGKQPYRSKAPYPI